MIYFGNDIVDTQHSTASHPRWANKVLSETEQAALPAAQSPAERSRTLLRYWAAKEAAFKAFGRYNSELGFFPRQFEFNRHTNQVSFAGQSLQCELDECDDYIYAFVFDRPRGYYNWIDGPTPSGPESDRVRRLAISKISAILSVPEENIEIRKRPRKQGHTSVPELFVSGRASQHLVSFSHHGRYVACALALVGTT